MNLGLPQIPESLLRLFFWLAVIGLMSLVVGAAALIYFILSHLHWS